MSWPFKLRQLTPVKRHRKVSGATAFIVATLITLALLSVIEVNAIAKSNTYLKNHFTNQLKAEDTSITNKLNSTFEELRFIATTLTALQFPQQKVSEQVVTSVSAYASMTPGVKVIRILNATGSKILWSSTKIKEEGVLENESVFAPFGGHVDELIGKPTFAPDFGGYVLATRLKVTSTYGSFFVSAPVSTKYLLGTLANAENGVQLTVYDRTTGTPYSSSLGFGNSWNQLHSIPKQHVGLSTSVVDIQNGLPWHSTISWNFTTVKNEYMESAPARWLGELAAIALIMVLFGFARFIRRTRMYGQKVTSVIQSLESTELREFKDYRSLLSFAANLIVEELDLSIVEFRASPTRLVDTERIRRDQSIADFLGYLPRPEPVRAERNATSKKHLRTAHAFINSKAEGYDDLTIEISGNRLGPSRNTLMDGAISLALAIKTILDILEDHIRSQRIDFLFSVLAQGGEEALNATDERSLLQMACDQITRSPEFTHCLIVRSDESNELNLIAAANHGGSDDLTFEAVRGYSSVVSQTIKGQPQTVIDDIALDERFTLERAFAQRHHLRSLCALPIVVDGHLFATLLTFSPHVGAFENNVVEVESRIVNLLARGVREINRRILKDNELIEAATLARSDQLTGLPNRLALYEHSATKIATAQGNTRFMLGIFDLDDFKWINDRFGHAEGDSVLIEFGQRMSTLLDDGDLLARIGGDEFVLVAEVPTYSRIDRILKSIDKVLADPLLIGDMATTFKFSFGYSVFPDDASDMKSLMKHADIALYQLKDVKGARRNWYRRWRSGEDDSITNHDIVAEPYGRRVSELLAEIEGDLRDIATRATEETFEIFSSLIPSRFSTNLSDDDYHRLYVVTQDLIEHLMASDANLERIAFATRSFCQAWTLTTGVGEIAFKAGDTIRTSIEYNLQGSDVPTQLISELLAVVKARVVDLNDAQGAFSSLITHRYSDYSSRPIPYKGHDWISSLANEMESTLRLPGIIGVGLFVKGDGDALETVLLRLPTSYDTSKITSDPTNPLSQSCISMLNSAFINGISISIPSIKREDNWVTKAIQELNRDVATAVAIAILDDRGATVAVATLFGEIANIFETPLGAQLIASIQTRGMLIWQQAHSSAPSFRLADVANIKGAFNPKGVVPHFQPIVELATGKVEKLELLSRIRLDDGTILSPAVFLPLLNEKDLFNLLKWSSDAALETLHGLQRDGHEIGLSINLHPATLIDPNLVRWLGRYIEEAQIPPSLLSVEILEDADESDRRLRNDNIRRIKDLGVQLVMDDFGIGYSNIARLRELPFDVIKLDRSLIASAFIDPVKVIELIGISTTIGRDLDIAVEVEGIERIEHLEVARALNANRGQGYLFSKPIADAELRLLLGRESHFKSSDEITSELGALAFHWEISHTNKISGRPKLQDCRLYEFSRRSKYADTRLYDLHRLMHAAIELGDDNLFRRNANEFTQLLRTLIIASSDREGFEETLGGNSVRTIDRINAI